MEKKDPLPKPYPVLHWYVETCMFSLPNTDFHKQTTYISAVKIFYRKHFLKEGSNASS